jgi:hypothetical protein
MKKIIIAGLGLVMLTAAVSCKKKEMKQLEGTITEGSWKITQFTDDNVDQTSQYAGSTFTFNSDGTLTVSGSVSLSGTWDVRKEDKSGDDDLFDDRHVELYISLPAPYDELTEDWEVEGRSDTRISLKDDSNSKSDDDSDDDDRLVFQRM